MKRDFFQGVTMLFCIFNTLLQLIFNVIAIILLFFNTLTIHYAVYTVTLFCKLAN